VNKIGTVPGNRDAIDVSVIICAHNPDRTRLARVLVALAKQDLAPERREILVIDNGSRPALILEEILPFDIGGVRVVPEPTLGLSFARARGFLEARGNCIVLVDDDNELTPEYLTLALNFLGSNSGIDVIGGPCLPEFDGIVPEWTREFHALLAIRDLGETTLIQSGAESGARNYPDFAPTGAGMVIRKMRALAWQTRFAQNSSNAPTDRKGNQLTSAGDNDIVLHAMSQGAGVAYLPALRVTHLLPIKRLDPEYLARLNEGIQSSWMRVLSLHGVNPWPRISHIGAWLRIARAWYRHRPWKGNPERIRFAGAKGHFLGRAT